jgi:hypothetical protein
MLYMDDDHMLVMVMMALCYVFSSTDEVIKGTGGNMTVFIRIRDQEGGEFDIFISESGLQIPSVGDDIIYENGTATVQHRSFQYDKGDDGTTRLYVVLTVLLPKEPANNIKVRFP